MVNRKPAVAEEIQGWMSSAELEWLKLQASHMDSVAEVGSWKGRSTFALLSGCPGPVYAVDHWKGSWDELQYAHEEATHTDIYAQFINNVGHFDNLHVVNSDSHGDKARVLVPEVDMVFIDACHRYQDVMEDLKFWWPKAKKLLCGHDIFMEGVKNALADFTGGFPVRVAVDSIWCIEKVPGALTIFEHQLRALRPMGEDGPGIPEKCLNCGQTTDNGSGACRFCGHPFQSFLQS